MLYFFILGLFSRRKVVGRSEAVIATLTHLPQMQYGVIENKWVKDTESPVTKYSYYWLRFIDNEEKDIISLVTLQGNISRMH